MASRTVSLSRAYEVHGQSVAEVVLNEPTGAQVFRLEGPPYLVISPVATLPFREPLWRKVEGYLDGCIAGGPAFATALRAQLVWSDIETLREALFDFFSKSSPAMTEPSPDGGNG